MLVEPVATMGEEAPEVSVFYDPLMLDLPDDVALPLTARSLTRLALVATETGARFERDGRDDAFEWLTAPCRSLRGRIPLWAALGRDGFIELSLLNGLSLDLDDDEDDDAVVDVPTPSEFVCGRETWFRQLPGGWPGYAAPASAVTGRWTNVSADTAERSRASDLMGDRRRANWAGLGFGIEMSPDLGQATASHAVRIPPKRSGGSSRDGPHLVVSAVARGSVPVRDRAAQVRS